jgi:hypothetical protein
VIGWQTYGVTANPVSREPDVSADRATVRIAGFRVDYFRIPDESIATRKYQHRTLPVQIEPNATFKKVMGTLINIQH